MNKLPTYVIVIIMVFCVALGFFGGSFLVRNYIDSHFEKFAKEYMIKQYLARDAEAKQIGRPPAAGGETRRKPGGFEKELGLDQKQIDALDAIFKRYDPEIVATRKRFYRDISTQMEVVQKEILQVLDENQKKKFATMMSPLDIVKMEMSFLPGGKYPKDASNRQ